MTSINIAHAQLLEAAEPSREGTELCQRYFPNLSQSRCSPQRHVLSCKLEWNPDGFSLAGGRWQGRAERLLHKLAAGIQSYLNRFDLEQNQLNLLII